ncbi:MAG TPA: hypothetical protein VJB59_03870 [Bdellovibrionota bacterium]|nr:hypothetical protein [Bdellovibrionota bacterium]
MFAGAIGTTDVDFLILRRPVLKQGNARSISEILEEQGFQQQPKSTGNPPVESYVKELDETEIEVEFLTDDRTRKKPEVVLISNAGIAVSLTFTRRKAGSPKRVKDLYGIWFVSTMLGDPSESALSWRNCACFDS